jgi:hypothetical protein
MSKDFHRLKSFDMYVAPFGILATSSGHCPVLNRVHTRVSSRSNAWLCDPMACK